MNSNGKSRKSKISNKLTKLKTTNDHLSFSTKDGTVLFAKARNNNIYLTSISNGNSLNSISTQVNRNKTRLTQGNESLFKIKEEILDLKEKNQKLMNENEYLRQKLNIADKTIEQRYQIQQNAIDNEIINDKRYDNLLSQSQSLLEMFVDIVEIFLFQTKNITRDSARMMHNNDNISFSIDVYEPSVYTEDDRRMSLLEQIQSLISFKVKIFQDQFGINIENMKGRVNDWNKSYLKDKDNTSNSFSFSNISQIKSKSQQNMVSANSLSCSGYNTSSNNVPLSPKFYRDEASDFCKSLNESELNGFNEKEDETMNKHFFTEVPKLLPFNSAFKYIHIKENEQEPKEVLIQFKQNKENKDDKSYINGVKEEQVLHTFNNENDDDNNEEPKDNLWNNSLEISFEKKYT